MIYYKRRLVTARSIYRRTRFDNRCETIGWFVVDNYTAKPHCAFATIVRVDPVVVSHRADVRPESFLVGAMTSTYG